MLRPILKYGARVLHQPAAPLADITGDTQQLIDDMISTMYAAPGVGLAAPQIGVGVRLCVIDTSLGRTAGELLVLVNPTLVERDGVQLEEEGCLSLPGFTATVVRPTRTVVGALDRHGKEQTVEGRGLLARVLQHELDHLDAMLFVDRLRGIQRDQIVRRVRKLQRLGRW